MTHSEPETTRMPDAPRSTQPPQTPGAGENVESICRNCAAATGSRFCGECGQRVHLGRLSTPALVARIVEDATDFDRGFIFTAWQLTLRPATAVREYLDGRQVRYTNPLRYLVVIAAITTLGFLAAGMMELYEAEFATLPEDTSEVTRRFGHLLNVMMSRYFNLLSIAAAPFVAFGSYLLFKPARRTFAEHLVFNAYTYAHAGLLVAALMIVARLAAAPDYLLQATLILWFVYWIRAAVGFFGIGLWNGIARGVVAGVLGTLVYTIVLNGGLLVYVLLTTG